MLFEDKKKLLFVAVAFGVTIVIWLPLLQSQDRVLTVAFLNVGQGDAIFITTPSKRQVLIDGGATEAVLRELGRHMSWLDRDIDMVVATHPDRDHIGGLVPVLERFRVDVFVHPDVVHDTPDAQALERRIDSTQVLEVIARRGQVFDFGDGVSLTILFPDRDVSKLSVNDASIVAKLVYGEHSFLLMGDAPQSIEEYVVTLDGEQLQSDVLKVGHHGSRTSSSEILLGFVDATHAVISRGCDNSYGHPHQEVIGALHQFEVEILDTCKDTDVVFSTDGVHMKIDR